MWCRKKIRLKLFGNTPTKRKKEGRGGEGRPYSKGQKKKREEDERDDTHHTVEGKNKKRKS